MSENNIELYKETYGRTPEEDGYNVFSDKYGQEGIEAYAERWLTGNTKDKHGYLEAEVDASRRVIKLLDQKLPKNGNDVVSTIDIRLQRITETILEEELEKMREGIPPYDGDNQAPLADTGAAVILDVNTGEILTMASYANSEYVFDLNYFARGISAENYNNLMSDPTRPMFPIAFQGGMEPGSVFKMLVAIAALEEGKTTPGERIYDRIRLNEYAPSCWSSRGHGSVNLMDALKVSCNYYFTAIGERLDIWELHKWAEAFGLHGPTGLELLKLSGKTDRNVVANPDVLEENRRRYSFPRVKNLLKSRYKKEVTDEQVWALVDINRDISGLVNYLREENIFSENDQDAYKAAYEMWHIFDVIRWSSVEYYRVFIGQSATSVTPLAVARYIAALVNGNKVLETHVVKEVRSPEGEVLHETRPAYRQLDIKESHTEAVKEGMRRVVYQEGGPGGRGTAVRTFEGMDPRITLGGKTGTAQIYSDTPEKNNAWFTAFTPYEEPEIAVVVAIPNGKTSGNASPIARRIIEEYYKLKESEQHSLLPEQNQLIP